MITVSAGTVMRGDLVTSGSVQLDGRFDGRIVCSRLDIGTDGYVNGTIAVRELSVAGQVVGQIQARSVTLHDTAFIEGDIRYAGIVLESGATLTGKAIRADANFVPDALAKLEADLAAVDTHLDALEDESRRTIAERAVAEYPAYEKAKRALAASR